MDNILMNNTHARPTDCKTNSDMNAFISFNVFIYQYVSNSLTTMKQYTQIPDIAHFKSGL